MANQWEGTVYEGENLDWGFVWTAAIPTGDSIVSSTWSFDDTLVTTKEVLADNRAEIWLTNWTAGQTYTLVNRVVMAPSGRTMDQTITVRCEDADDLAGGVTVVDGEWADGEPMVWADGEEWVWLE